MDDGAHARRDLGEVAVAPHVRVLGEVGRAVAFVVRVVPELDRHRGKGGGANQLAGLAARRVPGVIVDIDGHAEEVEGTAFAHGERDAFAAVSLDDGLVVPVVQRAEDLSMAELHDAAKDLATRARSGKLDRKWHTVEVPTHLHDQIRIVELSLTGERLRVSRLRTDLWKTGYFDEVTVLETVHSDLDPPAVDFDVRVATETRNHYSGALGWVGMMSFGMMYWMIQNIWKRELAKPTWASHHFWLATIGIVLYITSMWVAGIMQGLMWRAVNADGTLTYSFVESLVATNPYYAVRLLGGVLFLSGMFFFAWNTWKTLSSKEMKPIPASEPADWGAHA